MFIKLKYSLVVILFLIAIPRVVHSQFLNKNAVWTVETCSSGDGVYCGNHNISIEKDSIIDGFSYSIFKEYGYEYALREDSLKVFYKALQHNLSGGIHDSLEHLLYDFSLNIGDSVFLELPHNSDYYNRSWVVKEVDSVKIGNSFKKRLFLELNIESSTLHWQYWIEDVGSSEGPLCFTGISEHELDKRLYRYRIDNEKLYGKCITVGLETYKATPPEQLFEYNSIEKQIRIKQIGFQQGTINIYTLMGAKIKSFRVLPGETFPLSQLTSGIYIIELKYGSSAHREKIVIN